LPDDIRLKIEKSADKEDILLLLARLESDGVAITKDVYAAIVATLEYTRLGAIECHLGRDGSARPRNRALYLVPSRR
jgi:hypothetical protein